jgi:hypothetical protein
MTAAEQVYEQEMRQARKEYWDQKIADTRRAIVEFEAIATSR